MLPFFTESIISFEIFSAHWWSTAKYKNSYFCKNWKTPTGTFLLQPLFRQMIEKLLIRFGSHCNISAYAQHYEFKFSIRTNFDTLISNLNSYVQYKIVMTSRWRNIRKISKTISFVSSNPHIYRFSVTNYFLFGRYFNYSIIFIICVKKGKFLKDSWKMGLYLSIFDTQQSKDDVIVTSWWIWRLLPLRDFVPENCGIFRF